GVFCAGLNVSEIIGEAVVAMQHELTVYEIADSIHAHPTINEALKEAAAICIGQCYHWGS
ncbi:MAG: dihydrolipoyl dehydrogenase, partial [Sphaerochaetaceae bacterium]